jgi:cytidylate kinase
MPVVTIRGQLGSGAPEIGKRVAARLNIDYVDRAIIAAVAARLGYPENKIEKQEMPAGTLAGRISEALNHSYPPVSGSEGLRIPIPMYLPAWEVPLDDPSYLSGLESVIKELAASQSIVIRGRGSQFILKNYPGTLHFLVVAPLGIRMTRIMSSRKLDEKAAKQEITRFDRSRHEFIKRYFKAELEDPIHYDMVINTEHLSFEDATLTIINTLSLREQATND